MTTARTIVYKTLHLVAGGAYASDLLHATTSDLDPRDAALAEEIVMGVLRYQAQLDFLILHYSGRAAAKLDLEVRIALRMGIYQLRYLDRIPAHAAVKESVELVKRARKTSAAGLVNAVLRKVDRGAVAWPDRAVELSHPAWMLARWEARYGVETARAIARANLSPPETYIRVPAGEAVPEGVEPCAEVAGCYRVTAPLEAAEKSSIPRERQAEAPAPPCSTSICRTVGQADPEGTPPANRFFRTFSRPRPGNAPFRIQDIGSQAIVPLLELRPGLTFLDLCAAPGNKTAQALEAGVIATACDIHPHRLELLKNLDAGLVVLDGTAPLPFARRFDRILVDAPCSGTGTLARNPEIKWRLQPADIEELQARQKKLLAQARTVLAPGGRLVYSTCSLEREENEDVVAPYEAGEAVHRIPGRDRGDGFFAAVVK